MKATIRFLTVAVCFAGTLPASFAAAQGTAAPVALALAAHLCAQADDAAEETAEQAPADPRAEAVALLKQARAAMQVDSLDEADALIRRAEGLGVKFNLLQSFGDTPKKARRDLDKLRAAARKQPELPSERLAERQAAEQTAQQAPPANAAPADPNYERVAALAGDRQSTARMILGEARQALAEKDLPAAAHYYRQLQPYAELFPPGDDTLDQLAADIQAAGGRIDDAATTASGLDFSGRRDIIDPEQIPADEGHPLGPAGARRPGAAHAGDTAEFPEESPFGGAAMTEPPVDPNDGLTLPGQFKPQAPQALANARDESDKLVREARLALAFGDVERAAQAVERAKGLGVAYGYHDDQPKKVEAAIEKYRLLMASRATGARTEGYRRQYAQLLLEQAEALIGWGELKTAEQLAIDADRLQVSFAPFESSPKKVLERIAETRKQTTVGQSAPGVFGTGLDIPEGWAADGVQQAVAETPVDETAPAAGQAIYRPEMDQSRNVPSMQTAPLYPDDAAGPEEVQPVQAPTLAQPLRAPGVDGAEAAPAQGVPQFDPPATQPEIPQADPQAPAAADLQASPAEAPAAATLIEWGAKSLAGGDFPQARAYFEEANRRRAELDQAMQTELDKYLRQLSPPPGEVSQTAQPGSLLPDATADQKVLANKVAIELGRREAAARQLAENNPQEALARLQEARGMIEAAGLDSAARDILLRRVDRLIGELTQYIERNKPLVELKEQNRSVEEELQREMEVKLQSQQKLAELVDEFNTLVDEERFAEAIVVARRATEIMPNEPIAQQLMHQANFLHRHRMNLSVAGQKENNFVATLATVDESAIPFPDDQPYVFGKAKDWERLTASRKKLGGDGLRRSEKEIEIEQKLRTPVSLNFENAPLAEVMKYLGTVAEINIYLDPQGLAEEGVTTDDPVTINLTQNVQLRSALRLILEPKRLAYVIKDEVLKITSVQLKDGELITVNYNVADLVIPIPNFIPTSDIGMAGALRDAYGNVGFGANPGMGTAAPLMVAANNAQQGKTDPNVMAQISPPIGIGGGGGGATGMPQQIGFGPGGAGGGAQADFDSLIELITSTIAPTTWDEVGGPGSIKPFDTNLSLVVSQTQEVHEQIVDLLEQLRRLQDLQVTIEVRFITLNDNFFERIGVDFDFDIDDDIDHAFQVFGKPLNPALRNDDALATERDLRDRDHGKSITVGQSAPGVFSQDLDIPFTQNSFALAVPQFGGFDATAGAQLGFAILSDLEAFFFINAAQGDRRSNVLQAPKVTLFNGQAASVSDTSQSPFVISVIPVVGDFAAAQQPVIVVLSEGTMLTVQAVVSSDRRFVRLTVVPFFSQIGDVDTFTFNGSSTTTEESSKEGPDDDPTAESSAKTTITEGTTVQLPTFSFVTVTTTVSVPDGGTVLLGGIKRLSEGRNEFGVPMLNKLPYINRLFKNVGIGRETQSLMMMVTPRIIIQEEEEALLGIEQTQ